VKVRDGLAKTVAYFRAELKRMGEFSDDDVGGFGGGDFGRQKSS
jgi:hypothetical protein